MADLSRNVTHGRRTAGDAEEQAQRTGGCEAPIAPLRTPRQWRYQTRPSFKRVRGPLVDVFSEADEVLIVIDLGGFTRGEISLHLSPRQYILQAARGTQRFREVIDLPALVDTERARERLVNGVLEIVLPRRKEAT
ncbi:MAG: Hsp20/alpha crystallin family protein [Acidobacteria bacterium]|nr:Hsp20/alpha crystallin family protein [Acidobacteriota bacterium]